MPRVSANRTKLQTSSPSRAEPGEPNSNRNISAKHGSSTVDHSIATQRTMAGRKSSQAIASPFASRGMIEIAITLGALAPLRLGRHHWSWHERAARLWPLAHNGSAAIAAASVVLFFCFVKDFGLRHT